MLSFSNLVLNPTRVVILGVTGNIASGKSSCCRHLHSLAEARRRNPVDSFASHMINADKIGHEIYLPGKPCYYEVLRAFGKEVLMDRPPEDTWRKTAELPIDRKKLGAIVFGESQSKELRHLSNICWPHIHEAIEQEIENATNRALSNKKRLLLILLEAAALIESTTLALCDDIWIITCEKSVAVQRVMERDNLSREQAIARVESQNDCESKVKFLSAIKFKGEVRIFDTTDDSLSSGMRRVSSAFDSYWRLKLHDLQNDLQRAIHEEKERHSGDVEKMRRGLEALRGVLDEQQQSFQQLISRVTELRMARGEFLAARLHQSPNNEIFNTGCAAVDAALSHLQDRLRGAAPLGDSVLGRLSRAARALVTAEFPSDRVAGARATSVALSTRNEVRGTKQWALRHCRRCDTCGARAARLRPFERFDEKSCGLAAAPDVTRIEGKAAAKAVVRLVRSRPIFMRDEAQGAIDIFRISFVARAAAAATEKEKEKEKGGGGGALALSKAQRAAAAAERWALRALQSARQALANSHSTNSTNNTATTVTTTTASTVSVVEMVLHALKPRVAVEPNGDVLRVNIVLSVPLHVMAVHGISDMFADPAQREYIVQQFALPIARRIGECAGAAAAAQKCVGVAARAIDAIQRMAQRRDKDSAPLKEKSSGKHREKNARKPSTSTAEVPVGICESVRAVLLALAVFGTTVELDVAVPRVWDDADDDENNKNKNNNNNSTHKDKNKNAMVNDNIGGVVASAKRSALRIAECFLRLLTPPQPCAVPPVNDPAAADVVVRVRHAPTTFLEILNSAFSSSKRLPSTSRASVVDLLASPKAQIRYALKLFSEVSVDLFRPFADGCGVLLAKAKGGRPKGFECAPRAELPPDIARANAAVAATADKALRQLRELMDSAATESEEERKGKEMVERVVKDVVDQTLLTELREDFKEVDVALTEFMEAQVDVLLPFGLDVSDMSQEVIESLYLRARCERVAHSV